MSVLDVARVCFIGGRQSDAGLTPAEVGNKAANLARLDRLGLRVPPAIVLSTAWCREYLGRGVLPDGFRGQLAASIRQLEEATGLMLGSNRPLLVSVRSSPPASMPGMLETVLNVGLTEQGVRGLIRRTGNPWLAWDAYRRFVCSYGETVHGIAPGSFDHVTAAKLAAAGADTLQELDPVSVRDLARECAELLQAATGAALPSDPLDQVMAAIAAVLKSWSSPRAREYRRLNALDHETGTGVLIQAMVFGNSGARSGSGVGFTRSPATGEDELYLDFLFNTQGEDVVSGRHAVTDARLVDNVLPQVWGELVTAKPLLEREFRDMQDFEFTVDEGQLFFLQSRDGKRTPWAALQIAVDLVREGVLDPAAALERLAAYDLDAVARVALRPGDDDEPIARGVPAGLGVASGAIVLDADRAEQLARSRDVILVRDEITTTDIAGLSAAAGILTTYGARTSHAAVVARQLGKTCVVGCADVRIDDAERECAIGARRFREGDEITIDGETGLVYAGRVPVVLDRPTALLDEVARWT